MKKSTSASGLSRAERKIIRAKGLAIAEYAEVFFLAAELLRKPVRKTRERTKADIPLAVNAALSLELYFKSLITLEYRKFKFDHNFEYLFSRLPSTRQRRLIREHKKWERHRTFDHLKSKGIKSDLPTLLHISRNAFKAFRYGYSWPTDDTGWGLDVCLILVREMVQRKLRVQPHPEIVDSITARFRDRPLAGR